MGSILDYISSFFVYLTPKNIKPTDIVEIILIAMLLYYIIIWIRTTKAWSLVKGLVVLMIVWIIAQIFEFNAILWIFVNAVNVGIIALFIIFQPELRRGLEQLGRRKYSLLWDFRNENKKFSDKTVDEIISATFEMGKCKTGALMVIEGETSLGEYERTGITLDAAISAGLIINIFEHNTPLHDGAVIVRGDRITSATCILPVSDNMQLSKDLGTRHRAGVGLSEVADALVIIVSEENGKVSIAKNGQLIRGVDEMYLRSKLTDMQIYTNIKNNRLLEERTKKRFKRKANKESK